MDVCLALSLVCLYICVCECILQNNIHVSKVHCGMPSSQALLGYHIPAHHLCAFLMYLAR